MREDKIAVYLHNQDGMASFLLSNCFHIYVYLNKSWNLEREIQYDAICTKSVAALRKDTAALKELIDDCSIIAGGELSGIPFSVFDMAGFHIFSISEVSDEVLSGILDDIEQSNLEKRIKEGIVKNAKPIETDIDGFYFLDLIMLQSECPEVSSKKAMVDFLENTPFLELKLVCKHIPPWLENSGIYDIKAQWEQDTVVAVITKKQCG